MTINDLISEAHIFKNNFVRIDMATEAIKQLFPENTPKIQFDEDGMYIILDTFQFRDYSDTGMGAFTLTEAGIADEIKNTKKYYLEYVKPVKPEEKTYW